jgi:hypothetical protein
MKEIKNFESLVELLRNWRSWASEDQYDFGGMVSLLGACLGNLSQFALDAELEELSDILEPEQIAFLRKMVAKLPER